MINRKHYGYWPTTTSVHALDDSRRTRAPHGAQASDSYRASASSPSPESSQVTLSKLHLSNISFLFTNISNNMNKLSTLPSAISSCSAVIIVLTETWLSAKIKTREILDWDTAYTMIVQTTMSLPVEAGLVAVNEAFNSSTVPFRSSLEIVCVKIIFTGRDYISCAGYRSQLLPLLLFWAPWCS